MGAAPEVRRVGDIGVGGLNDRQGVCSRSYQQRRAAGRGRVLQRVARPALGRVHADGQRIAGHARADKTDRRLHRFGAGLAGKLPVGACVLGTAPMASATMVLVGLTA